MSDLTRRNAHKSVHEYVHKRLPVVDLFKAVAAQLVVLHHLAWYGPLSYVVTERWPNLFSWLIDHAPLAVQPFLVMGGYLAVRNLAPEGHFRKPSAIQVVWLRYQRLITPFAAALVLSVLCAGLATWIYPHEATPDVTDLTDVLWRFFMHLLLLHSIFDVDAITTGVWYVAIDFQLFAFMVLLLGLARWLGQHFNQAHDHDWALWLVFAVLALSLLVFNRNPDWDMWAIYFMGSYGLGTMAWWLITHRQAKSWGGLVIVTVLLALLLAFRERIALAAVVALLLWLSGRYPNAFEGLYSKTTAYFARISYSVFLVHFPVCLVINALFMRFLNPTPVIALFGFVLAWLVSNAAGAVFERYVERRP